MALKSPEVSALHDRAAVKMALLKEFKNERPG
jgi:hypothetical protein